MVNVQRGARAGIAAFALGLSLASPVVAVASADDTDHSSTSSSGSSATSNTGTSKKATGHTARGPKSTAGATSSSTDGTASKSTTTSKKTPAASSAASTTRAEARSRRAASDSTADSTATDTTTGTATEQASTESTATDTPAASSTTQISAVSTTSKKTVSANADPLTTLVNSIQGLFEGAALLVRRSFFNEAPSVSVVQLTGQTTGAITGEVDAVDPEGDHLVYKLTQQAHYGTVTLNQDGSYTYAPTPGGQCDDSNCIDSFTVSATDTGPHINLLNWFRTPSTSAAGAVYQQPAGTPRITFTFNYGSGSQFWSSAARASLAATAIYLSSYFEPQHDANIVYSVTGQYSLMGGTLASAGSDLLSDDDGFYDTVVQNKILTGVDSNGAAADGTIDWNFGYGWGYNTVGSAQYDFQSTAMHELLHTFGFISVVDSAGNNTVPNWTTFDSFMVTKNGTSVFNGDVFNTTYNPNLTGGDSHNGMYFGGANAVAAYGGPVPLYSPSPWESGSSMSHLDDNTFTGSAEKLMNASSDTGVGVRVLSAVEIAIMKDLGYTMVSQSVGGGILLISLMFVRRRKQLVAR